MPSIRSLVSTSACRWWLAISLSLASGLAMAQSVPVTVTAEGNQAHAVIGSSALPLADVTLAFEDADGLSPASLGISAELVDLDAPALLSRLPDASLTTLDSALPLLITIEPPDAGGLSFVDIGRIEVHTHALEYSLGSSFRLLKAPLGGQFRDITDEIAEGSVRARGSYDGFSQFLIVTDVRPTGDVIARKIGWLRAQVAALPANEQAAFSAQLDSVEAAVAAADYPAALGAIDAFAARARARSGSALENRWSADGSTSNEAGSLIAGASTLRFSVGYLRDFGQ